MNSKDLVVMLVIVTAGVLLRLALQRTESTRYRRKPVLTGSERDFFYRLRRALPECVVCPQVAISALIEPQGMGKLRQAGLDKIAGERVAFAVFDQPMRQVLAVIELDRHSRPTRRDVARDECFASAGIRTIRFHARRLPSEAAIHAEVFSRPELKSVLESAEREPEGIEFREHAPWRNTAGLNF